jgi:phosphoribosylamine--glycine ligase
MVEDLTVMVVDAGARGHAISQAYENSSRVRKIIVAPGNDFVAYKRRKEVVIDKNCSLKDAQSILEVARKHKADLVDVAQDDALAAGTVDLLEENRFFAFGPTKRAARIEWDKRWSREFMLKNKIPMPSVKAFGSPSGARDYVEKIYENTPSEVLYIKAAGLCEGKGALKSTSLREALGCIDRILKFGEAGKTILVEECLIGEEFSSYAISDGRSYALLKSAQDNKRALNFDGGGQTGGLGATSPAMVTSDISDKIESELISKAISGMLREGYPYRGILYIGGIRDGDEIYNIDRVQCKMGGP